MTYLKTFLNQFLRILSVVSQPKQHAMNEYSKKKEAVRLEIEEYLNFLWSYRLEMTLKYVKKMYEEQEAGFKAADDLDSYGNGGHSMLNGNFTNE